MLILTLVLIALKVSDNIDWSWIWVLAPMWLPPAVLIGGFVGFFMIVMVLAFIATVFDL